MGYVNFHVHSEFCHGIGNPEEYIKAGLQNNVESIGFSSHAPLPFNKKWAMKTACLNEYCNCINSLKQKYRNRINIFLGFEVDYIPGSRRFDEFRSLGADYIIGSNHFIGKDIDDEYKRIESSKAGAIVQDNVIHHIQNYYQLISEMIVIEQPDIIGHLDLIKKVNIKKQYFDLSEEWYRNTVNKTLEIIAASNIIIEVNTNNLIENSSDWLFPSLDILERCYVQSIPITFGSDAHRPEDIIDGYQEVFVLLKEIGFKDIMTLTSDGWKKKKLVIPKY